MKTILFILLLVSSSIAWSQPSTPPVTPSQGPNNQNTSSPADRSTKVLTEADEPLRKISSSPEEKERRRQELISFLDSKINWASYWDLWYNRAWNYLTFFVIFLNGLTSILLALNIGTESKKGKALVVTLPALAALITTGLTQYRVREIWQLRSTGIVSWDALKVEANQLLADDPKFYESLNDIYKRALIINRDQTAGFFSASGVANNTPPPSPPNPK